MTEPIEFDEPQPPRRRQLIVGHATQAKAQEIRDALHIKGMKSWTP
jgi:hypothetical protein